MGEYISHIPFYFSLTSHVENRLEGRSIYFEKTWTSGSEVLRGIPSYPMKWIDLIIINYLLKFYYVHVLRNTDTKQKTHKTNFYS